LGPYFAAGFSIGFFISFQAMPVRPEKVMIPGTMAMIRVAAGK